MAPIKRLVCHYTILKVDVSASDEEIKTSWKRLALMYHPDKTRDCEHATEMMKQINAAWEVLGNAAAKKAYDGKIRVAPPTQKDRKQHETKEEAQAAKVIARLNRKYAKAQAKMEERRADKGTEKRNEATVGDKVPTRDERVRKETSAMHEKEEAKSTGEREKALRESYRVQDARRRKMRGRGKTHVSE